MSEKMNKMERTRRDLADKKYQVFKGYRVKVVKKSWETVEQQFVVPWEMKHEEWKATTH